ncbi:MAG: YkgJ family cysteine cluster protein, partial [Marinirhabdus sp.]
AQQNQSSSKNSSLKKSSPKKHTSKFNVVWLDSITSSSKIDEDNDHVLQRVPCAFLGDANFCNIYSVRPKACREFPHTNRKKFQQITDLTLKNVAICPAAFTIVEAMKKRLKETGSLYSGQL